MTPEQLEAHRARFEQSYAKNSTLPIFLVAQQRNGNGYKHAQIQPCWQAYQWALADADRAQRAAPGVQGGEPPTDEELIEFNVSKEYFSTFESRFGKHVNPHQQYHTGEPGYLSFCRDLLARFGLTQPPQQSAQPVAWITNPCELDERGSIRSDELSWSQCKKTDIPLYAAAQPVEVQRVPLTGEQLRDITRQYKANTCHRLRHCWDDVVAFVRDVEAEHGIKPTSSEGGKHE